MRIPCPLRVCARGVGPASPKLLDAFSEAGVLKLTLLIRKVSGRAYDVRSSKHIGADVNLMCPELGHAGPEMGLPEARPPAGRLHYFGFLPVS
jgi:hypothetical protein